MSTENQNESSDQVQDSRRKFLKTAGKIAVYTPPAMLIMSQPSYATFQKSGGYEQTTHRPYKRTSQIGAKKSFLRRLFGLFR